MEPDHSQHIEDADFEAVIKNKKRQRVVFLKVASVIFFIIGVIWLCVWLFYSRIHVFTDDAYVHGNVLRISPQVEAGVQAIFADEPDLVERGERLVQMNATRYQLEYEFSKDRLASVVRQVAEYFYEAKVRRAELHVQEALLEQALLDLQHREGLVATGAISVEEFEQYQTNVLVAKARVAAAQEQAELADVVIEGVTVSTHPTVLDAATNLKQAYLNLIYTRVLAPDTGFIAQRSVQVGDIIHPGDTMMDLVPLNQIWIEANYKETQLKRIRIGQPVTFTADMHGHSIKYHGKVLGFKAGSGIAFALLPPENASGNWIKIVQRVPIRLSIDQEELKAHPLFLGVSIRVRVDTSDDSGCMLAQVPSDQRLYYTDIYNTQYMEMEEIHPLIEKIIKENSWLTDEEVQLPHLQES